MTFLEFIDFEYSNKISYNVTVTTYNPTEAQCDDTPNITADGTRIKTWRATEYRYVALSRDLLDRWGGPFDYGDYIVDHIGNIYNRLLLFRGHNIPHRSNIAGFGDSLETGRLSQHFFFNEVK